MLIYNTQTRNKEEFVPLHKNEARIYACGPTVYNYFHVGNARSFVVFDILRRYMNYLGYKVTFVQNFTDIDDKMIKVAAETGETIGQLADRFIKEYFADAGSLGITPADVHPRATEHIPEIIDIIKGLEEKGYAYPAADGVYFDTQAYPGYGRLSGQDMEEREAGARIDVDETKHHPMDFVLWKAQKPGEPAWDSPWGMGRPGWHIECSAMSMKYLGETLDIHAGGSDLVFPHHENEIAQSEGFTGKQFVNYWMHVGFINVDNRKMSKSKGNFFMVRDIVKEYDPECIRFFLLSAHYRSPINFSADQLEQAQMALTRLHTAREDWRYALEHAKDSVSAEAETTFIEKALPALRDQFKSFMDDDLNTAGAIGVLFDLVREGNIHAATKPNKASLQAALDLLAELTGVLGILGEKEESIAPAVIELAQARQEARAAKDWARADKLRDEIAASGYVVKDTPEGYKLTKN